MGCIDEFGHNKLAFLPAECVEVKYSTDGGSTWVDYGMTDASKIKMLSTTGATAYVGGSSDNATASNIVNLKLRVRIACGPKTGGRLYTAAKKLLINVSTQGAGGSKVDIKYRTIANYVADTETWSNVGTFDVVTCNPPYFKYNSGSLINDNNGKAIARHEVKIKLDDIIIKASYLLKNGGTFAMVHRPERMIEIINLMQKNGIEPKKMQLVYPKENKNANMLLIEGIKKGKSGLKILSPLIVHDNNGNYVSEIRKMFGDDFNVAEKL